MCRAAYLQPLAVAASNLLLVFLCGTQEAKARSAGITTNSCSSCHGSTSGATLDVSFEPETPNPGERVKVRIRVSSSNASAAGVAFSAPAGGRLELPEGEPVSVSGAWVTHSQPKPASAGVVEFELYWFAPDEPGSGPYTVAALAANGDNRQSGDRAVELGGRLAWGCNPVLLYRDNDGDGFGQTQQSLMDCEGLPGFAALDGDCDDEADTRYPGAPELCNGQDDDCDGEIDEEIVEQVYYLDQDGDGYGYSGEWIESCIPVEGYVTNDLDCHWEDPTIHPGAVEVCDLVDNDCDGEIDEGVAVYCGFGECRRKSDLCDLLCIPGEPTEEVCNGLDDDCDGEVDEASCPAGQTCRDETCVPDVLAAASRDADEQVEDGDDATPNSWSTETTAPSDAGLQLPQALRGEEPSSVSSEGGNGPSAEAASRAAGELERADDDSSAAGCSVAPRPGSGRSPFHYLAVIVLALVSLRRLSLLSPARC